MSTAPALTPDEELAEFLEPFYDDPEGFVDACFPWGEPGPLEKLKGPDKWQRAFLRGVGKEVRANAFDGTAPVAPLLRAVSSGHGIGKSTMAAWLVCWIMSTRPHAVGTVTANTYTQLETKTWAAVKKWAALCITAHWFSIGDTRLYHIDNKDTWFCSPQSCKEHNSEAFAGQHAASSTSFYIFDEDSAVPDVIHEVSEGGLTDGEPMVFRFGNPTRNTGDFHRVCFGSGRDRWNPVRVDGRDSALTNKELIKAWIKEYGEGSDFVRVRVEGKPPEASDLQFIGLDRIRDAQQRRMPGVLSDEPLLVGVDFSGGGRAWNVARFRRGADARSIAPVRVPGEVTRNSRDAFLAILADVLTTKYDGRKPDAMFLDSGFGSPYYERLRNMGFENVYEVKFGGKAPSKRFANMRAFMWDSMREWLGSGCIQSQDERLETDLAAPGYHLNRADALVLESKEDMAKRDVASPDDADALCLTFAAKVAPASGRDAPPPPPPGAWAWT